MTRDGTPDALSLEAVSIGPFERTDEVAIAVVGCGLHSTTAILPSLRHAPVRLVAVCDLDIDRAEVARRRFGAESAYGSIGDLLARSDIDAVIVVGPPELHVSAGIAALESERHVFVEKPPGNTIAEAVRLQQAGRAAGKQVMVGFNKRHATAYRLVKQIANKPEFGPMTSVDMTYAHWPVPGLRLHLTDMSIHALDTVRWLLGDPVRLAIFKRPIHGNHALALMLEHPPIAVSRVDLSAFQPGVQERLVVAGERTVVSVENLVQLRYVRQRAGVPDGEANSRVTSSWRPEFSLPDRENDMQVLQGYATEMIAFCDAIREGSTVAPSIDDGVAAMRLIEAISTAPDGLSVVDLEGAPTIAAIG
jgi:predicted dehydrogenase